MTNAECRDDRESPFFILDVHSSSAWAALVVVLSGAIGAAPAAAGTLPYSPALARVYDAILDARFDDAEAETRAGVRPGACRRRATCCAPPRSGGGSSSIPSTPPATRSSARRSTRSSRRWSSGRRASRAGRTRGSSSAARTACACSSACCGPSGSRPRATASASRTRWSARWRSTPNLQDAWFGIGLYHYYADIAPTALKMLRWMLALPGGNKVEGLREMLRARDRGELLRGEADFQLHVIYLWYEQNYEEALRLLEGLRAAYPHNPLFLQSIAEVQHVYRHDLPASLEAWRALFALARQRRVALPEMSEARARLGMATELDALARDRLRDRAAARARGGEADGALRDRRPRALPARARRTTAWARATAAVAAYQAAVAAAPPGDPDEVRSKARDGLRRAAGRANRRGLSPVDRRAAPPAAPRVRPRRPTSWRARPRSPPPIPPRSTARRCCWSRANATRRRSPHSNGSSRCGRSRPRDGARLVVLRGRRACSSNRASAIARSRCTAGPRACAAPRRRPSTPPEVARPPARPAPPPGSHERHHGAHGDHGGTAEPSRAPHSVRRSRSPPQSPQARVTRSLSRREIEWRSVAGPRAPVPRERCD